MTRIALNTDVATRFGAHHGGDDAAMPLIVACGLDVDEPEVMARALMVARERRG